MSLSPEQLRIIAEYTASIVGKINQVLANRITTTFTNSNDVIPSSKLVKDEFAAVRSEMPTNTSDLTNDGADGTHAFIVEGDSRLDDTRNPKPHNQASSTITDTNTYSNIGNTLQNQASINSAINEKIGALMNLDFIEQVSTRPTASADTLNKIYAVPENDPTSENLFQYFITIYKDNAYKWDKIDIAQVDISGKVDKVEGKQLSTEDYTTAEKTKLSHIEPEANKTIVDSAFINNSTNPVQSNVIQSSLNSKANVRDLAPLAFSGDYNDLINTSNVVEKSVTSGLIKNDGTIDTNQYLTSANIPESFNYGYVDSNLVLHLICVDGEVRVLHSIIQSGDANTISTVITDKDNNPLGGIPVDFLFNGVKQGQSVNSDANGVSTYNYTGTGAGKTDVQVRVGTFQSETYIVEDAIYTEMVNGVEKTFYKANTNTSVNDGVRTLTATAWSDWIPSTTNYGDGIIYFTIPFKVKINITDLSDNFVYSLQKQGGKETWGKYCDRTGLYEFIVETGKVTVKIDGEEVSSFNKTDANIVDNARFKFSMNESGKTLSYKDCRIYPI